MKRLLSLSIIIILLFSFGACNKENDKQPEINNNQPIEYTDVTLDKNTISQYFILLPENYSMAETMSAAEFNTFFSKAVGTPLRIVYESNSLDLSDKKYISIGKTNAYLIAA